MVLRRLHRYRACVPGLMALVMTGCASGAPKYVKPAPPAPSDWTTWRSGDASLHEPLETFLRQAKEEATGIHDGYRQLDQIVTMEQI